MIYEIISVLLILDAVLAFIFGYTKLGDNSVEQHKLIKRYLPLTKGWTLVYLALALYIGHLTFLAM